MKFSNDKCIIANKRAEIIIAALIPNCLKCLNTMPRNNISSHNAGIRAKQIIEEMKLKRVSEAGIAGEMSAPSNLKIILMGILKAIPTNCVLIPIKNDINIKISGFMPSQKSVKYFFLLFVKNKYEGRNILRNVDNGT